MATAAFIGASVITTAPVKAGSCLSFLAYSNMKEVIDGGGSWSQAWQAASQWHDGTEICSLRIKGQWKKYDNVTFN